VESWQGQAAGATSVVGKAVLTLYPPLRPLSHNVNPRDGAQDMQRLGPRSGSSAPATGQCSESCQFLRPAARGPAGGHARHAEFALHGSPLPRCTPGFITIKQHPPSTSGHTRAPTHPPRLPPQQHTKSAVSGHRGPGPPTSDSALLRCVSWSARRATLCFLCQLPL
jgi:hypothetical protein